MVERGAEETRASAFEAEVNKPRQTLAREFAGLLIAHKKWWLTPIVVAVLLVGALIILGGTGVGPFIYTLF